MDKKNLFFGILLIAAAGGFMFWQGKETGVIDHGQVKDIEELPTQLRPHAKGEVIKPFEAQAGSSGLFEAEKAAVPSMDAEVQKEGLYQLENDYIAVRFTSRGGAIKDLALKKYPLTLGSTEPFVFNAFSETPALAIGFQAGEGEYKNYVPNFILESQSEDRITFSTVTPEGVKILRSYSLAKPEDKRDPYVILHETRFVNGSAETLNMKKLLVNLGSIPPTKGDSFGEYLNVGYYNGKKAEFIKVGQFNGSKGFLGFFKRSPVDSIREQDSSIIWGSVKNQFFTSVLTPSQPAVGIVASPVDVGMASGDNALNEGLTGSLEMQLGQLNPGEDRLLNLEFYVGPKEFTRLDKLGESQDLVMQFGFFGIISKFLLLIMTAVHKVIPNWGLTIIAVTIIIKIILWPLTAVQIRSSKRMAKIQEPLKAIKEKYKNNPQKIQTETMKLFKANKVNPAGGCLPLLVQIPIFLGLYFMLRTSSELRFASFLWIKDLSVPDTVAYIMGFPVNILPLLMAISMFFQMKLSPSPVTDNTQKRIFQAMPFIFLIFCYNFPAGLVLYWTVQNLLTIVQQAITSRMKDPVLAVVPSEEHPKKSKTLATKTKKKSKTSK